MKFAAGNQKLRNFAKHPHSYRKAKPQFFKRFK